MYLEKPLRNKYTVGKVLRNKKNLRNLDSTTQIVDMPQQLQQYTDELISHGLQIKSLKFALFQTKNGLKYPGLVATEKIYANTILVQTPVELLLTTRDAFLSDIQKVFVENPQFFARRFTSQWEDRILLSYLLYENQRGKQSRWYNLIRNLPKDIDYAIFWTKSELMKLEDRHFERHIQNQRNKFEKDCNQLIRILSNYPQFFTKQSISRQNIIWIHTHLVTRCFGKYFEYTTMVPFAQLFNHQCTDVYYTMYYQPGNPHTENEEFYEENELTNQQIEQCDSSDGSYEADDYFEDDQLLPDPKQSLQWGEKYKDNIDGLKNFRSIRVHIFTFINFSDSVSLPYIKLMLEELVSAIEIKTFNECKQKFEDIHNSNVRYIRKVKEFYNKIKRRYYTYTVKQKRKTKQIQPEQDKPVKGGEYFQKEWPKDKFNKFYMLCSTKDQFEKGSQVFFCYGRLPNKLLLMRYGFALEHNKYDHMFLKIDVTQEILVHPLLKDVLGQIQISKYKRFKIKRTKMCIELLTYFRSSKWQWGERLQLYFAVADLDRELQVLLEAKQLYINYLQQYSNDLATNQGKLTDKSLGYHEYFALVYKIQQQRMIHQQIRMLDYALNVVKSMKNKKSLKEILLEEQDPQSLTLQLMMECYFKFFEANPY